MLEIAPILITKKKNRRRQGTPRPYPPLPTCLKKFLAETLLGIDQITTAHIEKMLGHVERGKH